MKFTPEIISGNPHTPPSPSRCLNCGHPLDLDVNYCPKCGQAAATGRLRSKDLVLNSLGTITRINKGVLHTCLNLLWRPWKVIAEFIHGQRLNYTDPIKLLIGLCFILIAIPAMFGLNTPETAIPELDDAFENSLMLHIVKFFAESQTFQYLIVFLPVVPVIMLLNRKDKSFRYNFAECCVGALYMSDAMLIVELLCLPLLPFGIDIGDIASFAYLAVFGPVVVYKAFAHFGQSSLRTSRKVATSIILIFVSYFLFLIVIVIMVVIITLIFKWDSIMLHS